MASSKKKRKNTGRSAPGASRPAGGRGGSAAKTRENARGSRISSQGPSSRLVSPDRLSAGREKERRKSGVRRALIAVAVVAAAAVIGYAIYRTQQPSDLPNPEAAPSSSTYAVPKNADKAGITVGKAEAPGTVDVYFDFMCPHCRDFEAVAGDYLGKQVDDGAIKVVYHPVTFLSGYSVWGSAAAACAGDEGKFAEFTTHAFQVNDGNGLDRDKLVKVGRDIGLTSKTFDTCVREDTYNDWALGLRKPADKRGVEGTPTIFLNGKKFEPKENETVGDYFVRLKGSIEAATKR